MEITFSKKTIFSFIISVWIISSIVYIGWDVWEDFKRDQMFSAYEQGRIDTIDVLISETEKCEPVSVTGTEKETSVIAVRCLTETGEE